MSTICTYSCFEVKTFNVEKWYPLDLLFSQLKDGLKIQVTEYIA